MVHWLLCGSEWNGGSRLQGINIHRHLRRSGIASQLTFVPPARLTFRDLPWSPEFACKSPIFRSGDVVVIHTLRGGATLQLIHVLKQRGVATVFVDCDLYARSDVGAAANEVVAVSEFLAERVGQLLQRAVHYIPDAVEDVLPADDLSTAVRNTSSRLRIGWVGIAEHWDTLNPIRGLLEQTEFKDCELVTISNHPQATVRWTPRSRSNDLRNCDIVVVPTRSTPEAMAKSVNRITQAMALGRPVAAGRIPAYTAIIQPGENGFLCDSPDEWAQALRRLRDPQLRRRIAESGYELATARYTMTQVGARWQSLLEATSGRALEECPAETTPRRRLDRRLQIEEWDHFAMQYRDRALRVQTWIWGVKAIRVALQAGQFRRAARLLRRMTLPPPRPSDSPKSPATEGLSSKTGCHG
jgi:hypothetical protein